MTSSRSWHLRYAGHLGLRAPNAPLFAHSARSRDVLDQIDFLADQGFAGAQDLFLKLRSPQEQEQIGKRIAQRGLSLGTFNNNPSYWNQPLWTRSDADARAILQRELDSSIEVFKRVGGGAAICVTAFDAARARAEQIDAMIDNLRRCAQRADSVGLTLYVEAVAAAWIPGLLPDRLAEAEAIVRAVNSPAVKLLFDIAHVQTSEGDVVPLLQNCWDIVGCIQAADTPGRIDIGAGTIDWLPLLRWISDRGYRGLIEIEHLPLDDSAAGEAQLLARLRALDAAM